MSVLGLVKFTDFELRFLKELNIVLQGNTLMNLNNGVPFSFVRSETKHDRYYEDDTNDIDCYIFKSNSVLLEFRRVHGDPTNVSVYVKSRERTCFARELINCDMKKKLGCECHDEDLHKNRIIGVDIREYGKNRDIGSYVTVEPVYEEDAVTRSYVCRYLNGQSTIQPHVIECTENEIFDDVYNCHGRRRSGTRPDGIIGNENNFEEILLDAINDECHISPSMVSFYKRFMPLLVETYSKAIDYSKSMNEEVHKK